MFVNNWRKYLPPTDLRFTTQDFHLLNFTHHSRFFEVHSTNVSSILQVSEKHLRQHLLHFSNCVIMGCSRYSWTSRKRSSGKMSSLRGRLLIRQLRYWVCLISIMERQRLIPSLKCFIRVTRQFWEKCGTFHWEFPVSCTTQKWDVTNTSFFNSLLYYQSISRLRGVKHKRKFPTFSSKSGRGRLWEVVAYKRF